MASKSNALYAVAKEIGTICGEENRNFMACKARDENPAACLDSGAAVQNCALGVLNSAMETCGEALSAYATCLDRQISEEYMFDRCRPAETAFQACRQQSQTAASIVASNPVERATKDSSAMSQLRNKD